MCIAHTRRWEIAQAEVWTAQRGKLIGVARAAVWKIGHLANREILQMPDVPGGSLLYNEGTGLFHERMLMHLALADDRPNLRFALRTLLA